MQEMCQIAIYNVHQYPLAQMIINRDPTRTTVLRNMFVRDMNSRFRELAKAITQSVVEEDVFGLRNEVTVTILAAITTPGRRAFAFPTNRQKVASFMDWINRQINAGILDVREITQVGSSINGAWSNKYIFDSYERGVARARTQLIQQGYSVPRLSETGGIAASMASPIHLDRVGLLYTRAFNELRGITAAMEIQMSRYLSQGLIDGLGPSQIARALNAAVIGGGADLGLEISYVNPRTGQQVNYFMPGRRRAEILARTETIRAHAHGTLQEYQNWGVVGVHVEAELITAGDDRVCEQCANLEGSIFAIKDAWQVIPVHAQCRCAWIPTGPKDAEDKFKWKDTDNINELKTQLKSKLNIDIRNLQIQDIKRVNIIGRTISNEMFGKISNLALKGPKPMNLTMSSTEFLEGVKGAVGTYDIQGARIVFGQGALLKDSVLLNTRFQQSIGSGLRVSTRHEYAHHIYYKTLTANERAAWDAFYKVKKPLFKDSVGWYSMTDASEGFAEALAAYTSPAYNQTIINKSINLEIRELLEKLVGKRIDL